MEGILTGLRRLSVGQRELGRVGVDGPRGQMRRLSRINPVWLFPATYILHLCEEYFAGGGFPLWAQRTLRLQFSDAEFVAWNAVALALMCLGAWLVSRDPRFRFIEIAVAVAVLGNVAAHVLGSVTTRTYSPGLFTGIVLWMPVGVHRLQRAWAASTRKGRVAGMYIGVSVVLVTIIAVAARALLGR